jgi:NADPH:quinone reductase
MHAVRVHTYGDASQLIYEEAPIPQPKAGEVRVQVRAIGLNFLDVYQRKGQYPNPLPFTPGNEFAGIVDAVGEGVTEFQAGERVSTASGMGAYGELALAPAARLVHIPSPITFEQAAALMLQGMTAHYLTHSTYPLKPGDTALIHAAAGGTGQLLVQIAKKCGARVIATVSSEEKAALARSAGADEVILYSRVAFDVEVRRLTDGKGVDVVYDGVGRATFHQSLNSLRPRGMMVLFGWASGSVEPIDPQLLFQKGSLFLTRPSLVHHLLTRAEVLQRAGDVFGWVSSGALKLRIDRTFALQEAAAAHQYIESGATRGKVLLLP